MRTLLDSLEPDLDIVSIGINPSLISVERGFYFARPQNRFWKALNRSRLVSAPLVPSRDAMRVLRERDRIGMTDVVARPTAVAAQLEAADWTAGARALREKLERLRPRILWFHGKTALAGYLRALGEPDEEVELGRNSRLLHGALVFCTFNPSPANAHASLDALVESYDELARLRDAHCGTATSKRRR